MNYYEILGVSPEASQDDIKSSFRKLAVKYHPDKNPDNKEFEAKFKLISEAYDTLKDPEQRKRYNENGFNDRPQQPQGFHFNFNDMFGGGHPFGNHFGRGFNQHTNPNYSTNINITLEEAFYGKEVFLTFENKTLKVNVPKGVMNGQILCLKGEGSKQNNNLRPGDLHCSIGVQNHNIFQTDGQNLKIKYKINVLDFILGNKQELKSLDGKNIVFTLPTNVDAEHLIRIKGKGMPILNTNSYGDLYIMPEIFVPEFNDTEKKFLENLRNNQ